MRKTRLLILAAAMLAMGLPAHAGGGYRHGHGHSHARVGVFIGAPLLLAPLWWPYYYPPAPVVVRERVIVREPLVFYDEYGNPVPPDSRPAPAPAQPQAQAQAPAQQGAAAPIWYFCADSQTYYPYAQSCASAWQRVVPHPPPR